MMIIVNGVMLPSRLIGWDFYAYFLFTPGFT